MTTAPATTPPAGLLASLNVRTWLDHTIEGGQQFAPLLLTHPPARRRGESVEQIERDMRLVADALGAVPPGEHVPYVGDRISIRDGGLLLVKFDGGGHMLRVRKLARLAPLLDELGHMLLVVGLDPLDPLAHGVGVDRYVERVAETGRCRFAAAGIADTPRSGGALP